MHFAILGFTLLMCVGCHVSTSPLPPGMHEQDCECPDPAPVPVWSSNSSVILGDASLSWQLPPLPSGDLLTNSTHCHEVESDSGRGRLECDEPGDAGWSVQVSFDRLDAAVVWSGACPLTHVTGPSDAAVDPESHHQWPNGSQALCPTEHGWVRIGITCNGEEGEP